MPASAATFIADFTPLNDSGVEGQAFLDLDESANTLTVTFDVNGLEPGVPHVSHIHGLFNNGGQAKNSFTPTLDQDADGDGFIELAEGAQTYGDVLVPLGDIGASDGGASSFSMTYDLSDPGTFNKDYVAADLMPLQLRELVIHGLTVPAGPGEGTDGEVDGTNGFLATLPVASAEIRPYNGQMGSVPEPATWATMLLGFFAMGGFMRTRRRRTNRVRFGF